MPAADKAGVGATTVPVNVGDAESTLLPVPVEVVTPVPPLATGKVPVVPPSIGKPVTLVSTPLAGVPKAGVTSVGLLDNTTLPVPVDVVTPVPPRATERVPVVPAMIGRPVVFAKFPDVGVPSAGVTNVGDVMVGDSKSALVAIATAMLLNSVLISVPLTIFSGSPDGSESFVAKFVDCV